MPRLSVPPTQPFELSSAITLLGNHVRVELIRSLTRYGPADSNRLAHQVGVGLRQALDHLRELERAGLVFTQPTAGARGQLRTEWHIRPDVLEAMLRELGQYIAGH